MKLSEYATEELKRLVAGEWRSGEYVQPRQDIPAYVVLVCRDGGVGPLCAVSRQGTLSDWRSMVTIAARRVTSFTDVTPLDPTPTEMADELRWRERPVVSNREHAGRKAKMWGCEVVILMEPDACALRMFYKYSDEIVVGVSPTGVTTFSKPDRVELL